MKFNFLLLLALFLMVSCGQENIDGSTKPQSEFDDWSSFLAAKTKDWKTISSDEKRNVCGWADNPGNTIDCTGGDCFIRTDVPGHDACIGCSVSDELACFGPNGTTFILILEEMALLFPTIETEFEVFDEDDVSLGNTSGQLGAVISSIKDLSEMEDATTYSVLLLGD